MSDIDEKVRVAAARLKAIHFDAQGCGTWSTNSCSICFDRAPMSAEEVARAVLEAV